MLRPDPFSTGGGRKEVKTKNIVKQKVEALIKSGVYVDETELYEEAIRTLFEVRTDLKMIAAIELYKEGEVSLGKASEIAGTNIVQFKNILAQKGIIRWVGAGEEKLKRRTEELKKLKR